MAGGSGQAGGATTQQPLAQQALNNLPQTAVGPGGTPGMAAAAPMGGAAQMPQWQRGMLGAMTGNPAYGSNAPYFNRMLQMGTGMMMPQQQMPQARPQMPARPMQATPGLSQFMPAQQVPQLPAQIQAFNAQAPQQQRGGLMGWGGAGY